MLSDLLAPQYGQESLRYSLLVCGLINIWAALHFYLGGKYLADDLKATADAEE